jgi:hypothetical protein
MRPLNGAHKLLMCQQLPHRQALLLLALTLSASLPVLGLASEVFKYGDEPEHAGNQSGTHWTYGEQQDDSSTSGVYKPRGSIHWQQHISSCIFATTHAGKH